MSKAYWQHYSHPADIGIRGVGPTKEEAFSQAALALTAIITDLQTVESKERVDISCEEQDDGLLFVNWLNALLYEMATQRMLFSKFDVKIEGSRKAGSRINQLHAKAWGERIDLKKHSPAVEVKAATYTDLNVEQDKDGNWLVQCIVDV